MDKLLSKFKSVTIFILTNNEEFLLRETISKIKSNVCFCEIHKIIIVAKNNMCDGYFEAERLVAEDNTGKISIYLQEAPTVELCINDLPAMVESSHFVIMAADMETNPDNISDFIEKAKLHPEAVICAAKWHKESVVEGYGVFHELGSRLMNTFVAVIFNRNVKDPFFVYQIYPMEIYKKLKFNESTDFVYAHTLKVLQNNVEYIEIPTVYKKRSENISHVNIVKMFKLACSFCLTAIKVRFSKRLTD